LVQVTVYVREMHAMSAISALTLPA
jgi:hypothetical protein